LRSVIAGVIGKAQWVRDTRVYQSERFRHPIFEW